MTREDRLFGQNIRDTVQALRPRRKYAVEFQMCGHPELIPTMWDQPKPEAAQTIGECPVHNYSCPLCGFGAGCAPSCDCPEMR